MEQNRITSTYYQPSPQTVPIQYRGVVYLTVKCFYRVYYHPSFYLVFLMGNGTASPYR